MIKFFLTQLLIMCALVIANAQIKKIPSETAVKSVTIFSVGARVERTAAVSILPGRTEISFSGLSNQLDQQSVQLQGDAAITLLSVQTGKDFLSARKIDENEKGLNDNINSIQDKLDKDRKMLEVYKNEEAMLVKNQSIGGQQGVKSTDLKEALELQRQLLTDVYMKELEIQKQIADAEQKIITNKKQLQEISKKKDSVNFIVTALIESKIARTVNFQLFYNVKDAGWYPSYDVRLNDLSQPFNIAMNANVFQRSGETWKNVSLILSTGNPGDNATPSLLQSWVLGFYDPSMSFNSRISIPGVVMGRVTDQNGEPVTGATVMVKGTKNGAATDVNGFFRIQNPANNSSLIISSVGFQSTEISARPGYYTISLKPSVSSLQEVVVTGYGTTSGGNVSNDEGDRLQARKNKFSQESMQAVSTNVQYQPTTLLYKMEDPFTLETDGKTTTINIKQTSIPASYQYFSAPKIAPYAFLTAQILNWKEYDLQSGEANLYFEGTYLGKTYIDLESTVDTLTLSMGKDNGVKVSRKLVSQYSSKKFIGSNRTDSRQYEINIQNVKRDSVSITVTDQFPVPAVKEISVEDQDAPEGQVDKNTGIITWRLILPPGREKKLTFSYSVKYPKDKKLILD
ncbi:MAG: mucoidy inhibitor MuiA family protein [Bacteroidetes bacterium]|nr:mucoidy inhibitor MuiA family protein [Bacteroidota bacterium]MBS1972816.1 mucoidy inhibitor MuiA family protein [Bacteroidota bacterium]